jgi:hypothetical protein
MAYSTSNYRPVKTQTITTSGSSAALSTAVVEGVDAVYLTATENCYVAWGASPTATTSDMYLAKDWPYCMKIAVGEKLAALQVSTGGTLYVTEVSE